MTETPWVAVKDVCGMYGLNFNSAKNKIAAGKFEVPVYKVGKVWVIDRVVHETYFARLREAGLRALSTRG